MNKAFDEIETELEREEFYRRVYAEKHRDDPAERCRCGVGLSMGGWEAENRGDWHSKSCPWWFVEGQVS